MKLISTLIMAMWFFSGPIQAADFRVEKTPSGGAIVHVDGKLFTEYVVDQANKPYLWPIHGPSGKLMTRSYPMKDVEGEPHDHPHHRGLTFGHEDLGGTNTWAEVVSFGKDPEGIERAKLVGSIRHKEYKQLSGGSKGVIHATADYVNAKGEVVASEERRLVFTADQNVRVIDVNIDVIASQGDINVEDKKDAGMSFRVPHSMSVDAKQGGAIVNSDGLRDADAWGKRARWCDFHGPVEGELLGVAMLNHPTSFRYPTPWHARTYGLFTANPFGPASLDATAPSGTFELKKNERIRLRHRVILHRGNEQEGKIAEAFEKYAAEMPDLILSTAYAGDSVRSGPNQK